MKNWLSQKFRLNLMLVVASLVFIFSLILTFLPKSLKEPIDLPFWVREIAGEIGGKYWLVLVIGGLVAVGRDRSLFAPLVLTLLIIQLAIEALKLSVGEIRPDGRFFNSFPSGHTTASFGYATFMSIHFRWGWLWYLFAAVVGLSRIITNAHWWHDVVGGAALGYIIATTFCRWWQRRKKQTEKSTSTLSSSSIDF
ncbi:MAG: phosphatase PAP2 family protein [Armatimonadetes bacterium]|nr:phosphatase PAP2 family protein [Armatimonadota bacterium]MDW8029504.1 phosphatase PAP2 family protein [Armatimonadota bacterium]